uniref:Uncharacterized protein n=1 Tax=Arcella intermedia TaxID=1963864 RepID=A0A6B2L5C3_9EUKA
MEAACCLLQGQAFEALENRKQALNCYSQALKEDIFCYEAFHTLIDKQMLTSNEEAALLEGLDFKGNEWLKQVYLHKIKKFNLEKLPEPTIIKEYNLHTNPDIITSKAESFYFRNQFEKAYALTKQILEDDPYDHNNTVVIHLSCLVELSKKSELFYLAHKLVEMQPNESVSWYAVGCYYYLIRKYEKARRYFSKSTTTTKDFGPGWLGFGHAFAIEGEHDQALAAYRSAHRLLSKSHIPPLYIGIELVRANNLPLARQFVKKSESGCPYDPLVYNELGVIDFKDGKYNDAIINFEKALGLLSDVSVLATWEPIFFNLGHCYRKLRQYHNAIKYYKKALKLSSQNSTTYTALAYTHHLLNNTTIAIELYHKALALNPDDNFASRMLSFALEEEAFFQTWIGEKITEPMDQT